MLWTAKEKCRFKIIMVLWWEYTKSVYRTGVALNFMTKFKIVVIWMADVTAKKRLS